MDDHEHDTEVGNEAQEGSGERLGALDLADEAVLEGCVEAILLTSEKPLGAMAVAQALSLDGSEKPKDRIERAIARLNETYETTDRSFRIREVAGGYRVMTEPTFAPALLAMHGARQSGKLSKPALEALAIVAYRQPVTRAQVESIRGVSCGEVIKSLLERRLIDIVGRAEELGRPMLYGTSKHFLEVFGLGSIKDLPPVGDVPDLSFSRVQKETTEPEASAGDEEGSEPEHETSDAPAEPELATNGADETQ